MKIQKIAAKKMVPRRPNRLFKGSESQQPIKQDETYGLNQCLVRPWRIQRFDIYDIRRIDETNNPLISAGIGSTVTEVDIQILWKRKVCAVGACLIPASANPGAYY